jgi:hypothetical protein
MSDRSQTSRALIEAARGARPSAADRARLKSRLDARIAVAAAAGASALGAGSGAAAATAAKGGVIALWLKLTVATAVVGSLGGGAYALYRSRADTSKPAIVAAAQPIATSAPAASATEAPVAAAEPVDSSVSSEPATEPSNERPSRGAPATSARRAQDAASLAAQITLLRQAQGALNKGDAEASLKALDALAARHADGAFREEQMAAHVLALCAAGRVDQARVEGQRFIAEMPHSVQAARVRSSCAFAKAK